MSLLDYIPSFIKDTFVQNPVDAAYYDPQFNQYKVTNQYGGIGNSAYGPFLNAPVNAQTANPGSLGSIVAPAIKSVVSSVMPNNNILTFVGIGLGAIVIIKILK